LRAIAAHAGDADIHVLPTPRAVRQFLTQATYGSSDPPRWPRQILTMRGRAITRKATEGRTTRGN
jgi:hypothetical protein